MTQEGAAGLGATSASRVTTRRYVRDASSTRMDHQTGFIVNRLHLLTRRIATLTHHTLRTEH